MLDNKTLPILLPLLQLVTPLPLTSPKSKDQGCSMDGAAAGRGNLWASGGSL